MDDEAKELQKLERILVDQSAQPTRLSYALLRKITNNFSEEIGSGGFGVVYMGVLQNGKVAVKMLSKTDEVSEKQFMAELTCLIRVKDKNIVRFLGYCSDTQGEVMVYNGQYVVAEVRRRLLCFEYVPNKSLHDYLEDESRGREWSTRYQLIRGICQGLCYLHKQRINHLDLKPLNILLDDDMIPKITDFGLSRRFEEEQSRMITKNLYGSFGYTAPEYQESGEISFKSDIYSLGIIIMKLLKGSNAFPDAKKLHESLDLECPQVMRCVEIAQICVDNNQHKRPTIEYIIDKLDGKGHMTKMVSWPVVGESRTDSSCSSVNLQAKSDSNELLGVNPQDLYFVFEVNKHISCPLQLTNKTDSYVAFNVKTTTPKKCMTVPNKGILLPRSTCKVSITIKAQKEAPLHMQRISKFLVQNTIVEEGLTDKDTISQIFNKEKDKVVKEVMLCAFSITPFDKEKNKVAKAVKVVKDMANFDLVIAKHPFIVIDFYVPGCDFCNKLAPEYEKAAQLLSTHEPPIVLAKFNASDEKNKLLATKYEVQGFPTLKMFRNQGQIVQTYKGPREAEGIVDYLKKQVVPASKEIKAPEDAANLDDGKIHIIGVFTEFSGTEFANFMEVAVKLRPDYDFGHTLHANHLPLGDAAVERPLVRLFKPFDELVVDSKDFDVSALEKFIEANSIPKVVTFDKNPNNRPYVAKFMESSSTKVMLFLNFSTGPFEFFKSTYYGAAEEFKDKEAKFLIGDIDSNQGAFKCFGLKEDLAPLIFIEDGDCKKFFKSEIKPYHIVSWLKEYFDGKLSPFRKTEPIPEANNEAIKVVVADNLNDVVFKSGKNVFIEFYEPWCGYCKELAPILDEAANTLQSEEDVVIAKMDATANDVPDDFDVLGYPTLYFITPSGKTVCYDSGRTTDEIVDFIRKNKETAGQAAPIEKVADPAMTEALKDEL